MAADDRCGKSSLFPLASIPAGHVTDLPVKIADIPSLCRGTVGGEMSFLCRRPHVHCSQTNQPTTVYDRRRQNCASLLSFQHKYGYFVNEQGYLVL